MRAPSEIPHADEALRALFDRFKAAPGSPAFGELAEALLARGHATEALRVAEHGLQLTPQSADGRVHRAQALIALARPKVAYVELLRALAIDPKHRKALRLLGKVYVEEGRPERAADLLRRRHDGALIAESPSSASAQDALTPKVPPPLLDSTADDAGSPIPELFASLTKDLGLGPVPEDFDRQGHVEVTQVMRDRRPKRGDQPLSKIEGPIVDTTQPGRVETNDRTPAPRQASLHDVTSPEFHITVDESGVEEGVLRPVSANGAEEAETIDDTEPMGDALPNELDLADLRKAISGNAATREGRAPIGDATTEVTGAPEGRTGEAPDLPYLKRYRRTTTPATDKEASLEVVKGRTSFLGVVLAVFALAALIALAAGLLIAGSDELRAWVDLPALVKGSGEEAPPVEKTP